VAQWSADDPVVASHQPGVGAGRGRKRGPSRTVAHKVEYILGVRYVITLALVAACQLRLRQE